MEGGPRKPIYYSAIVAGLYWKRVAPPAGFWGILAGAVGGLVSHFFLYRQVAVVGSIHPLFFGPLLSLLALAVVTRVSTLESSE